MSAVMGGADVVGRLRTKGQRIVCLLSCGAREIFISDNLTHDGRPTLSKRTNLDNGAPTFSVFRLALVFIVKIVLSSELLVAKCF